MTEYKPGAAYHVTYKGNQCFAYRKWAEDGDGQWVVTVPGESVPQVFRDDFARRHFSDIAPLVCLPLTREDADALQEVTDRWRGEDRLVVRRKAVFVMDRIIDAIREQRPAPLEIPENLGAVVEMPKGDYAVYTGLDRKEPWLYTAPSDRDGTGASAWWTTAAIRAKAVKVLSVGVTHA